MHSASISQKLQKRKTPKGRGLTYFVLKGNGIAIIWQVPLQTVIKFFLLTQIIEQTHYCCSQASFEKKHTCFEKKQACFFLNSTKNKKNIACLKKTRMQKIRVV
jgi:hypothetical protein